MDNFFLNKTTKKSDWSNQYDFYVLIHSILRNNQMKKLMYFQFLILFYLDISDHGDQIQSICWHGNGNTLVTSCKDKKLRVMDPRSCTVTQVYLLLLYTSDLLYN